MHASVKEYLDKCAGRYLVSCKRPVQGVQIRWENLRGSRKQALVVEWTPAATLIGSLLQLVYWLDWLLLSIIHVIVRVRARNKHIHLSWIITKKCVGSIAIPKFKHTREVYNLYNITLYPIQALWGVGVRSRPGDTCAAFLWNSTEVILSGYPVPACNHWVDLHNLLYDLHAYSLLYLLFIAMTGQLKDLNEFLFVRHNISIPP